MAEPTVQVPVSLIEEVLADMGSAAEAKLRALLSQPTPTAEQCKAVFPGDFHGPPMYCTAPVNHQGPHDADGMRWLDPSTIRDVTPPAVTE